MSIRPQPTPDSSDTCDVSKPPFRFRAPNSRDATLSGCDSVFEQKTEPVVPARVLPRADRAPGSVTLVDCEAPTPTRSPSVASHAQRRPRLLPPYDDRTLEQPAPSFAPSTDRMETLLPPSTRRSSPPSLPARTLAIGTPPAARKTGFSPKAPLPEALPARGRGPSRGPGGLPRDSAAKGGALEDEQLEEPAPPAQRRPRPELSRRIMLFAGGSAKPARTSTPTQRPPLGWMVFGIAGFTFGCLSLAALAGAMVGGKLSGAPAPVVPVPSSQPISLEARIESCAGCTRPANLPGSAQPTQLERPSAPASRRVANPAPPRPEPASVPTAEPMGLPEAGL